MTRKEVELIIDEVRYFARLGDAEAAHATEDALRRDFIKWVSEGEATNAQEIARMILSTDDIDFPRWCA